MRHYVRLLKKLDRLNEQIERLESNLYFVHPSTLSDMPRGSLRGTDGVTDDLCKLSELREERDKLNKEIEDIHREASISDKEYRLVYHREILQKPWKDIAEMLGYSVRHVQRKYDKIMEKICTCHTNRSKILL